MKKGLCQFLNSFSAKLLGLLFGVALFTFFIGLSPVNAGTTINTGGYIKSGNQTNNFNLVWTGECQNPFIFLTIQHYRTRTVSSMTYDGQAMTLYSTGNGSGNSFVDVYYYIPTTATGTKQISYTQSATDWSGAVAIGLCNVNPNDPIEDYYINTGTASGNQSNSDVDVNYNGSFMLSWLSYAGGATYNTNLSDINLPWTIQEQIVSGPSPDATWIRNYIGGGTINSGQNQTVAWTSEANWIGWGYVVLTPYTQSNSGAYLSLQPSYTFPTRFSGQVNFTYDPNIFYNSQDYIKIETCAGTGNDIPDCNDLTLIGTSTIMTPPAPAPPAAPDDPAVPPPPPVPTV